MENLVYFAFLLGTLFDQTLGYDLSLNGNAELNQPLEIIMNIGTINTVVVLNRPDGSSAGTCLPPNGGCTAGLTQDVPNGITTFSIASVSRSTDEGVWSSQHGGAENGNINITVLTIPTLDVSQAASGSSSSIVLSSTPNTETLTTAVTCAYPHVSLGLVFKPQGGGSTVSASSSTSTCTSTGNTGCSDTDANSYTCTITPQYEAGLVAGTTYNIHVTVNLDGQYQSIGLNDTITDTDITVQGTPTTPAPSPCRCGWDWLPCDWECYYFYIIIAAVVVVVVFLLVVGVCCCCRCGDDDAEAYVCCMRKKKSCKESLNLNENENGQMNVPRSSENGRQVNPSESGKENTSESPCHNNPAYFESEGTDM